MTDAIRVGISDKGKAVYATEDIPRGEEILRFTGHYISFKQSKAMGTHESYAVQVAAHKYLYPDPPAGFINHSCDPNCGLRGDLVLVAIRDIRAGEELTYDYSTTMFERSWTMRCKCGSPICRKLITDFDLLPPERQWYYLEYGVVQPYIIDILEKQNN